MTDFSRLKARRIYQFFIDEETGEITDITKRTDYVPVIRCKDCKHHHYENHYEYKIPYCNLIDYGYGWTDNDFCSRAERKEE